MNHPLLNDIANLLVCGSSFSLIALAFGYIFERERYGRLSGFALYFLHGTMFLLLLGENLHIHEKYVFLMYLNQPMEFFWAPVFYWYIRTKTERTIGFDPVLAALCIPAVIAFAVFIPFFLQPAAVKLANPAFENFPAFVRLLASLLWNTPVILLAFAIIYSIIRLYTTLGERSREYIAKLTVQKKYLIGWLLVILLVYTIYHLHIGLALKFGMAVINTLLIAVYYLEGRAYLIFSLIRHDTSAEKYKRSRLKGIDHSIVIARISELFETDQLYLDETISLPKLAEMLSVSAPQLSEIFNAGMGMSFKSYLNSCRINAARKMLSEPGEVNILQTAYCCGYNSKSSFNAEFMKQTGMTPSDYRQARLSPLKSKTKSEIMIPDDDQA